MTMVTKPQLRGWAPWVATAAMSSIAAVSLWQAHDLRSADAAKNQAVVNVAASTEVQSEISKALVGILSFDYSDPTATADAAGAVLTGKARDQYTALYASLAERAPGQKLVLSATVQAAAVKSLSDRDAVLLVFVDQASRRDSDREATYSAAQLSVTARKHEGGWKISDLSTL